MINSKLSLGLASAVILVGLGFWVGHHVVHQSGSSNPVVALQEANAAETTRILQTLSPALKESKGLVTPAVAGLSATRMSSKPNTIVGIQREWQRIHPYTLDHLPKPLTDSIKVSAAVWQAGFRQADDDAIAVAGNDPLAIVANAGPGSAEHFQSLVSHLYDWDTQSPNAHWMQQVIGDIGQSGSAGMITVYPATHQIPGTPRVITLLKVPLTLTEYGYSSGSHDDAIDRHVVVQTATAVMALTHVNRRWQWWIEGLKMGVQKSVSFPS